MKNILTGALLGLGLFLLVAMGKPANAPAVPKEVVLRVFETGPQSVETYLQMCVKQGYTIKSVSSYVAPYNTTGIVVVIEKY